MPPRFQDDAASLPKSAASAEMEVDRQRPAVGQDAQGQRAKILQQGDLSEKRKNTQSLNYMIRSGIAGGMAGCAVSDLCAGKDKEPSANTTSRPKRRSLPLTVSRSSSKPPLLNLPSIAARGPVCLSLCGR